MVLGYQAATVYDLTAGKKLWTCKQCGIHPTCRRPHQHERASSYVRGSGDAAAETARCLRRRRRPATCPHPHRGESASGSDDGGGKSGGETRHEAACRRRRPHRCRPNHHTESASGYVRNGGEDAVVTKAMDAVCHRR